MNEKFPNIFEKSKEHIPTSEEVGLLFESLIEDKKYKTERQAEDEKGLFLWTITFNSEDEDGYTEYEYTRKGRYEKGDKHGPMEASDTAVHVTFYDENDFPVDGNLVAQLVGDEWILTNKSR